MRNGNKVIASEEMWKINNLQFPRIKAIDNGVGIQYLNEFHNSWNCRFRGKNDYAQKIHNLNL